MRGVTQGDGNCPSPWKRATGVLPLTIGGVRIGFAFLTHFFMSLQWPQECDTLTIGGVRIGFAFLTHFFMSLRTDCVGSGGGAAVGSVLSGHPTLTTRIGGITRITNCL